ILQDIGNVSLGESKGHRRNLPLRRSSQPRNPTNRSGTVIGHFITRISQPQPGSYANWVLPRSLSCGNSVPSCPSRNRPSSSWWSAQDGQKLDLSIPRNFLARPEAVIASATYAAGAVLTSEPGTFQRRRKPPGLTQVQETCSPLSWQFFIPN